MEIADDLSRLLGSFVLSVVNHLPQSSQGGFNQGFLVEGY